MLDAVAHYVTSWRGQTRRRARQAFRKKDLLQPWTLTSYDKMLLLWNRTARDASNSRTKNKNNEKSKNQKIKNGKTQLLLLYKYCIPGIYTGYLVYCRAEELDNCTVGISAWNGGEFTESRDPKTLRTGITCASSNKMDVLRTVRVREHKIAGTRPSQRSDRAMWDADRRVYDDKKRGTYLYCTGQRTR